MLKIEESGTYTLKLRRWPVEVNLSLNAGLPARPAIPGTSVKESREGKILNITEAGISIQNIELSESVDPNAEFVEFSVELNQGEADLKTWFHLDNGETIGAYYVSIEKLYD